VAGHLSVDRREYKNVRLDYDWVNIAKYCDKSNPNTTIIAVAVIVLIVLFFSSDLRPECQISHGRAAVMTTDQLVQQKMTVFDLETGRILVEELLTSQVAVFCLMQDMILIANEGRVTCIKFWI
jgi:hypothetical protein